MKIKIFFMSLLVFSALGVGICFASDCRKDPFLRELRETEDDFRVVTILKEREFKFRGTAKGFECAKSLLGLYLQHEEFDVADNWLSRMTVLYPNEVKKISLINRLRSEMAFLFGNYAEAEKRIASGPMFDGADILREFSRAADTPYGVKNVSCLGVQCDQLRAVLVESTSKSLKSPGLALALGIVPGLGQVYAGRAWSGIASFLLNSVLIGTTVYGIDRGEYAFAVLSGAVSTGVYLGSIYAGYESVRRYNEQLEGRARAKIRGIDISMKLFQLTF